MRRPTWLDQIVYSFQHRWETNPQFRAMASGLVGLVLILIMCSCMGVLNATANSALAAIGLGGTGSSAGAQGTLNTGTNQANGYQPIPTPSVVYPTGVVPPQVSVPQSQTPPPYPTATSTATPTDTPSPGGGGGGGGHCSGGGSGTSWSFNPCPPVHSQSVTFSLSAPGYGGQQIHVEVSCGTTLIGSASSFALPPSGNWSQTVTLAASDAGSPCRGSYLVGAITVIVNGPTIQ